jgi:hypothetical protein
MQTIYIGKQKTDREVKRARCESVIERDARSHAYGRKQCQNAEMANAVTHLRTKHRLRAQNKTKNAGNVCDFGAKATPTKYRANKPRFSYAIALIRVHGGGLGRQVDIRADLLGAVDLLILRKVATSRKTQSFGQRNGAGVIKNKVRGWWVETSGIAQICDVKTTTL